VREHAAGIRHLAVDVSSHVKACYTFSVASRNVTLALPEELLRRLKILAAQQDTSISALLTATLSDLADQEEGYAVARDAMISDMERGYDLGTCGQITWSRDSLHER
jgi:predicted transcriptional regulator